MNNIPIYLINLAHRTDRLQTMQQRLCSLDFERIPAIYGSELSEQQIDAYNRYMTLYQLSANEAGCFSSHKKAWQKILDDDVPYACILEDDAILSDDFSHYMVNTDWLPNRFDVIKLETWLRTIRVSNKAQNAYNRELRELLSSHPGAAAYIVSNDGARKLLAYAEKPTQMIDNLIFQGLRYKETRPNFSVLQMIPALCVQEFKVEDVNDSDLRTNRSAARATAYNVRRSPIERLMKIAKRIMYRVVDFPRKHLFSKQIFIDFK